MTKREGGNVVSERGRDMEIHLRITEAICTGARGPNKASGFLSNLPPPHTNAEGGDLK